VDLPFERGNSRRTARQAKEKDRASAAKSHRFSTPGRVYVVTNRDSDLGQHTTATIDPAQSHDLSGQGTLKGGYLQ
jgi:hypothetical protein